MLKADNLIASHKGRRVLHEIDAEARAGALTILLGPNASGKSTLLRCLAGIHPADGGRVTVNGREMAQLRGAELSRRIAYVPQENPMAFAFTVAELVNLGASVENKAENALHELDLIGLEKRSLLTLSGGERQRAAIARAVAQDAEYLLLDEPTAHLDLRHQKSLLDLLRRLAHDRNKGVLVALHDLNLAAAYADHILLLRSGRIAAAGTPAEALRQETLRQVYETEINVRFLGGDSRIELSIF